MARILIQNGTTQREVDLTEPVISFGRAPENSVVLEEKEASRRHFQIERTEQGFKLVDLESRNGTRVNDRVVNQQLLADGDRIRLGSTVLLFEGAPAPVRPEPEGERPRRGGTTTIEKIRGIQRPQTSEGSGVTKGVAIAAASVVALLIVLLGASSSARKTPRAPQAPEVATRPQDPPEDPEERTSFEEIRGLESTLELSYARALDKCRDYESRYPQGRFLSDVRRIRAVAEAKASSPGRDRITETYRALDELVGKRDYAEALRVIGKSRQDRELLRYELDLAQRKAKVCEEADQYYRSRIEEAYRLLQQGKQEEARASFQALQKTLGGLGEFDLLLRTVEKHLQQLGS